MQLVRKADGNETDYKFHRAIKLGPGEDTTVWSSEAHGVDDDAEHDPPHSLVMKGQTWFVGNKMSTTLYDMEGQVRSVGSRRWLLIVIKHLTFLLVLSCTGVFSS